MNLISQLSKKRVLILGLGREGLTTLAFLRKKFPRKKFGLADQLTFNKLSKGTQDLLQADKKLNFFLGKNYLKAVGNFDLVLKSPGVSPNLAELKKARRSGVEFSSHTALFFDEFPGTIIGVTGTKGKSTTTSLIFSVLKEGGLDVRLAGNIGIPLLSQLNGCSSHTIFVTELSSFQLMDLTKSPRIAVIQGVYQEHTDYHSTFENYIKAKTNIVKFQGKKDRVIFNAAHLISKRITQKSRAEKIPFGFIERPQNGCFFKDTFLVFVKEGVEEKIIHQQEVALCGHFNLQNVMPAIIVGKLFKIPTGKIVKAIKEFKPLEHRLEFVDQVGGVSFYNDSLSTIPEATIAAINSFLDQKIILIAGGFDRGQNFSELARVILKGKVRSLVLFPTTGSRIWQEILKQNHVRKTPRPNCVFVSSIDQAVQEAYRLSNQNGVILLSPASASFSGFRDYADRGNQFKQEVGNLKKRLRLGKRRRPTWVLRTLNFKNTLGAIYGRGIPQSRLGATLTLLTESLVDEEKKTPGRERS